MLILLMTLYLNVTRVSESIMDMEKAIVQLKLHGGNTSILTLEHTLLDLSSNPQLTQTTFLHAANLHQWKALYKV